MLPQMKGKICLFLFLFFVSFSVFSQEICDNALDDDNDGLVDLNDPDCNCAGLIAFQPSLIDNPSFEDTLCCPQGYGELNCTQSWQNGTNTSPDFFHTCGFTSPTTQVSPPWPVADGEAFVGFINNGNYKEYVGTCLSSPLQVGTAYTLKLAVGFGLSLGTPYSSPSPFNLTVYGNTDCSVLPIPNTQGNNGCPLSFTSNWLVLGTVAVNGSGQWVEALVQFTPGQAIESLIIGPDCNSNSPATYYFVDHLMLGESTEFGGVLVDSTGSACDGTLTLHATPYANPGVRYQWYKDGVALTGETQADLHVPMGPGGLFQVRAQDGICCDTAQLLLPTGNRSLALTIQGDFEICQGEQSTLDAGSGFSTYEWTLPGGTQVGQQINVNEPGLYIVLATDDKQCQIRDTVEMIVNELPQVQVDLQGVRCAGEQNGTVTLSGGGGVAPYLYQLDNGPERGIGTYAGLRAGNYPYRVQDAKGCATTGILVMTEPDFLQLDIDLVKDAFCGLENGAISLSTVGGTQPYSYSWQDTHAAVAAVNRQNLSPGLYQVFLNDANGCRESLQIEILGDPVPQASFFVDVRDTSNILLPDANVQFHNQSKNGFLYQWDFGDSSGIVPTENPSHRYTQAGTYRVQLVVFNRQGETCPDTAWASLTIKEAVKLYFPNAFSPNNDGHNDVYRLFGQGLVSYSCQILNRWGEVVFTSQDLSQAWDGTRDGTPVPEGVYTVLVEGLSNQNEPLRRSGTITLIR